MKLVNSDRVIICAIFPCVVSTLLRTKLELEHICAANYGNEVTEISGMQSVVACSERCASLPECRSLLFDPGNGKCKINDVEATSFPQTCSTRIVYGRSVKATSRQRFLFEPCISDEACKAPHSDCTEGVCTCTTLLGYTYLPRNDSCVTECDRYGSQFLRSHPGTLSGHDDAYFPGKTVEECKYLCISQTRFVCRAIEYDLARNACYLTSATTLLNPTVKVWFVNGEFTQIRTCA